LEAFFQYSNLTYGFQQKGEGISVTFCLVVTAGTPI